MKKPVKRKKKEGDIPTYPQQKTSPRQEDINPMSLAAYENIPEEQKRLIQKHGTKYWCEQFPDHPACRKK